MFDNVQILEIMNHDVPKVVTQARALRKRVDIGDSEWWHGMFPHSGPDHPTIQQLQSDHIPYLRVIKMLEQNVLLGKTTGHRDESELIMPIPPCMRFGKLRVWRVQPLIVIQDFLKTVLSSLKIKETVLEDLIRIAMLLWSHYLHVA
jgi:hypothetical protein